MACVLKCSQTRLLSCQKIWYLGFVNPVQCDLNFDACDEEVSKGSDLLCDEARAKVPMSLSVFKNGQTSYFSIDMIYEDVNGCFIIVGIKIAWVTKRGEKVQRLQSVWLCAHINISTGDKCVTDFHSAQVGWVCFQNSSSRVCFQNSRLFYYFTRRDDVVQLWPHLQNWKKKKTAVHCNAVDADKRAVNTCRLIDITQLNTESTLLCETKNLRRQPTSLRSLWRRNCLRTQMSFWRGGNCLLYSFTSSTDFSPLAMLKLMSTLIFVRWSVSLIIGTDALSNTWKS